MAAPNRKTMNLRAGTSRRDGEIGVNALSRSDRIRQNRIRTGPSCPLRRAKIDPYCKRPVAASVPRTEKERGITITTLTLARSLSLDGPPKSSLIQAGPGPQQAPYSWFWA